MFSTSVEVHHSDHTCFKKTVLPIHLAPLEFLLEKGLSTAILSSDPKRLPPEMHIECHPTANPSHYSQSFGTRAFDPAAGKLHDIRVQIPSQTPSSLELLWSRARHNKTTWNITIAKLCLCFLCTCSCQNTNSPLFLKFLPLGILGRPDQGFLMHI